MVCSKFGTIQCFSFNDQKIKKIFNFKVEKEQQAIQCTVLEGWPHDTWHRTFENPKNRKQFRLTLKFQRSESSPGHTSSERPPDAFSFKVCKFQTIGRLYYRCSINRNCRFDGSNWNFLTFWRIWLLSSRNLSFACEMKELILPKTFIYFLNRLCINNGIWILFKDLKA